jgi:hypothetical protein
MFILSQIVHIQKMCDDCGNVHSMNAAVVELRDRYVTRHKTVLVFLAIIVQYECFTKGIFHLYYKKTQPLKYTKSTE